MNILFIAPNPRTAEVIDGYVQRILAIDSILDGHSKEYYDDLRDTEARLNALVSADVIYIHSVYQAFRVLAHMEGLAGKTILDLHGAVPEEELYLGNRLRSRRYLRAEATAFRTCNRFVAVSQAMIDYYDSKYPPTRRREWVLLPVFDRASSTRNFDTKDNSRVVYAGGTQRWQLVTEMMSLAHRAGPNVRFDILTHNPTRFADVAHLHNVAIRAVAPSEVNDVCRMAGLGLLLRDDNALNIVACPTKLIEYLSFGVVPIMKSSEIGDFKRLGLSYISTEDFVTGRYRANDLAKAREQNIQVLEALRTCSETGVTKLQHMCSQHAVKNGYSHNTALKDAARQLRHDRMEQYKERIPRARAKLLRLLRLSK